ncbi:ATPase [Actinorhabdospora filicis]|uniref:histidine kinase n=1 Tax=Actinorhabdospora filicis TaxID=1785913 RepID=A0A9W6SLD8_9ACTN|nr:histidine kinase [Actinorhabdospora filicis]GLZ76736.1 ATPase [Actinorhabdospora filicis]
MIHPLTLLWRASGPAHRPIVRNYLFDTALALFLSVMVANFSLFGMYSRSPTAADRVLMTAIGVLSALPLIWRRRFPLTTLSVILGVTLASMPVMNGRLTYYHLVVACVTAVLYGRYLVATVALLPLAGVLVAVRSEDGWPIIPARYAPLLVLVPFVLTALGVRDWRDRTTAERERLARLEHAREEELRAAVADERARIARELHDVVTHGVSVMVIQSGAARRVMDADGERAREALLAVEATGRDVLGELRHVVGLLGATPELAPQPGLDELDGLVGRLRDAGLPVTLRVEGAAEVPPGPALAAYRVVQEALTNTLRYAVGGSAAVTVVRAPERVHVEVTDTGGPAVPGGGGHGLMGLRERLALYGGELSAGPRLGGGWRVAATIPIGATA